FFGTGGVAGVAAAVVVLPGSSGIGGAAPGFVSAPFAAAATTTSIARADAQPRSNLLFRRRIFTHLDRYRLYGVAHQTGRIPVRLVRLRHAVGVGATGHQRGRTRLWLE